MRLVSLGFFRDECSDTMAFYRSIAEVNKFMVGSQQNVKAEEGRDGKVLRILVIALAVFAVITIAYCCLKHRSKICCCGKRGKGRDTQLDQDSITSVQMARPKKAAEQADSDANIEDPRGSVNARE